ncbi:MAG: HEAT repeat domain-containing protein [Acidobacteriia bacterium]|nr:HEAT repeat domain-containing protein [Terriglobia bacterium]
MRYHKRMSKIGTAVAALAIIAGTGFSLRAQIPAAAASLDQILKEISSFDGGIDSAPFWKLRDYVYARKDTPAARAECETRLLEFLGTSATPVAKMAVCRQLRVIGSDKSVPVLQAMLLDPNTSDMALYALQKIPGTAADKVLIQTVSKTEGAMKTAVIAALGDRKCNEAVAVLVSLLKPNGEYAGAAALALGEIGGETAARPLVTHLAAAQANLKPIVAASIMKCAEGLMAVKNERAASGLYDKLLGDPTLPVPIRRAAMIGKISVAGDRSAAVLMDQLKGSDVSMQEAAIVKIKDVFKPEAIGPVCSLLPGLQETAQIKLLAVLSLYPKERVLSAVLLAARSGAPAVRIAALKALESVGNSSTVPFLLESASKARGAEQGAARNALGLLKGRQADDTLLALLAQRPSDDVQGEILLAVAERRIFTAKSTVAGLLSSASPRVRLQALRTLRAIGTPSDMPSVLALLVKSDEESEQMEAMTTTAALAQKIANPDGRSNSVKARLAGEKDANGQLIFEQDPKARARLYRVLSRIGDDSALPLLRQALNDQNEEIVDAAARAIAAWPTTGALDDAVQLAQKSRNETHRLLALQGMLRMIRQARYRRPEAAVADLRQVYVLSSRTEEKKLILGVLPNFACPEALDLAGILLGDPSVKAEAQAAIEKIKPRLTNK